MARLNHERLLEHLLEHTTASVEIADVSGRLVEVNRRFTELTGFTREEAIGLTPADLSRSDMHDPAFYEAMWETVTDRRVWRGEMISQAKDESLLHMFTTVIPVLDEAGDIVHLMALKEVIPVGESHEDNETLAHALMRLRTSERRYRAMMHAARDAILVADLETALIVDANPTACEMFDYSVQELRQLTGRKLTAPEDHDKLDSLSDGILHRGSAYASRLRVVRKDGSRFWAALRIATYELSGQKLYVVNLRDVSEQVRREAELAESNEQLRAAQKRLRQSERLAALGQLSAAMAHEINNPLQFVDINLKEMQRRWGEQLPAEASAMLEEMRDGINRISNITRDLGTFTRIDREKVEMVDLDEVVERACRMARNEIRHHARLRLSLGAGRRIAADRGKLTQVITNLIINASHAIVEGHADENAISVTTREQGETLLLQVEDSGTGMPPELVSRIFEPFFTTKPAGRGGGLGLAVCAEIVRLHRGTIKVDSELGRGSRFDIRLPFDNGLMVSEQAPSSRKDADHPRGRVLLIDDDALVLRGIRRLLSSRHEVVTAEGGNAGIRIVQEDQRFDVILCDLMMPMVDGLAVHEAIQECAPQLIDRLVFCSGGAFTVRAQEFISSASNPMLRKPIRGAELFDAIEGVMARNPADDAIRSA